MEKGQSSRMKKTEIVNLVFIAAITEDLLHNILSKLDAKSFAFASCVNRSWNGICSAILSRPKMISAFSQNDDYIIAGEEAIDKVLSEPIRPHFVIANTTCGDMEETLTMITKRVGSKVPVIVSLVTGVLGKEACNDKAGEVKLQVTSEDGMSLDSNYAILLTVGYFPGMKVDVIPVIQSPGQSEGTVGDKFVRDIRNFVSQVSDDPAPACLMLFGDDTHATEPIVGKLDYAMPEETIIVGDHKGEFLHKRANESRITQLKEDDLRVLAGLVIARDKHRPIEARRIQFHSAISRAMKPVINLRYKAVNVSRSVPRWPSMFLTAKRPGEAEVLNGEQILDDIEDVLGSELWEYDPYIGVIKRRKYSVGSEKSKIMSSLAFHELTGADEQYLTVNGAGIKTGDFFQVYCPDHKTAEASLSAVNSQFKKLAALSSQENSREKKTEVVGGFIFACNGRGACFFNRPNVDSAPIIDNFPKLPFGGIFCGGEIGRYTSMEEEEEEEEDKSIRKCLHVYCSVYLLVSFTT